MLQRFLPLCFLAITALGTNSFAQQPNLGCDDKGMRLQAEQIKQDFKAQGLTVYKDAMVTMESHQPFPVAVQFEKGKLYQMVFIGSKDAKKMNLELYDGQDKKIDERSVKDPKTKNVLVYSFVPEKSDMYLVVLTQTKASKQLCGSFTIMQAADPNTPAVANPSGNTPAAKPAPTTTNPRYNPPKKK